MRRTAVIVLLLIILFVGLFAYLQPKHAVISEMVGINASQGSVVRALTDPGKVENWWPAGLSQLHYNDSNLTAAHRLSNTVAIDVKGNQSAVLTIAASSADAASAILNYQIEFGSNPLSRIKGKRKKSIVEKELKQVLQALKTFSEDQQNIYGITIRRIRVKDSLLLSVRKEFDHYPAPADIYGMIDRLQQQIALKNTKAAGHPMLNVSRDVTGYSAQVAIPVSHSVAAVEPFQVKRMVMGFLLETEVKGGDATISKALTQMQNFMKDYRLSSPAIPFQSLITNRLQEPDTNKWITRIYYPVL